MSTNTVNTPSHRDAALARQPLTIRLIGRLDVTTLADRDRAVCHVLDSGCSMLSLDLTRLVADPDLVVVWLGSLRCRLAWREQRLVVSGLSYELLQAFRMAGLEDLLDDRLAWRS